MKEEDIAMYVILYVMLLMAAGTIYDVMRWWDTYRHRYVYIALVFYPIVFAWLLIYYPLLYIYNKFYRIKW